MGGDGDARRRCAVEMARAWEHSHNFELYDDVLPVLEELRRHRLGSASSRTRRATSTHFVEHHRLDVDAVVSSRPLRQDEAAPVDLRVRARAARRRAAS